MNQWGIYQYKTVFDDFYSTCDIDMQANIDSRLDSLKQLGNEAKTPISKPLGDGIFELRAKTIRQQSRILYCFEKGKKIILLHTIIKKDRAVPQKEIEQALKRRKEILNSQESYNAYISQIKHS